MTATPSRPGGWAFQPSETKVLIESPVLAQSAGYGTIRLPDHFALPVHKSFVFLFLFIFGYPLQARRWIRMVSCLAQISSLFCYIPPFLP